MIIEFFGLPGSGKTTIAKMIEARTDFRVVKISGKSELLLLNLIFLAKHPVKFAVTLWHIVRSSPNRKLFYYKFMNLFLHHNAKYEKALRVPKAILDQGHFQNILSVFEKPVSISFLMRYACVLPPPDKLVIFDISSSAARSRVLERGYVPRKEFGDAYQTAWIKRAEENYRAFLGSAGSLPVPCAVIHADRDAQRVYNEVLTVIESL